MARRVRVLLLIPHLGGGGAEHVMALLARGLSPQKFDLHIGLVTQTSSACHELPGHVIVHPLGARRVRTGALSLLRLVWKLRPEVVFSTMAHLNFLVLLLRVFFPRKTRVLIRQNATVSSTLSARTALVYARAIPTPLSTRRPLDLPNAGDGCGSCPAHQNRPGTPDRAFQPGGFRRHSRGCGVAGVPERIGTASHGSRPPRL